MNEQDSRPVDGDEAEQHLVYVQRWVDAVEDDERRSALGEGLWRFGLRFYSTTGYLRDNAPQEHREWMESLAGETLELLTQWLLGDSLTDRADEVERRALVALDVLDAAGSGMARLAATSLLELPEGHPLRDVVRIRDILQERAQQAKDEGDLESAMLTLNELLTSGLVDEQAGEDICAELIDLAGQVEDAEHRMRGLRGAMLWHLSQVVAAREDKLEGGEQHLAAVHRLREQIQSLDASERDKLTIAWALEEAGESRQAADMLAPLVDGRTDVWPTAAWLEGMIRLRIGDNQRAIESLEAVLPREEREYMLAIGDEDVEDAGNRFSKDGINLAFAYAYEERWSDALAAIERIKSARLRHAMKLHGEKNGRGLLQLEAQMASLRRGVPGSLQDNASFELDRDPLAARLSRNARLMEEYREKRPELAVADFKPPTLAEVAQRLAPGEAVISLGSNFTGTFAVLVTAEDRDSPAACLSLNDLPHSGVAGLFVNEDGSMGGWALELAARMPVDPMPALDKLLARVDAALGVHLAGMLEHRDISLVTIIPHRMLHLIPFWALPSLEHFEVRTSPGLAQWAQARRNVPRIKPRLTAVGNPTLDLALADVEAEMTAWTMASRGFEVGLLNGSDAEEDAIRDSLKGSGFFHFAGHGMSRPMQPLASALLAHPPERFGWPVSGDPMAPLASDAEQWIDRDDGTRYTDTPEGRLIEYLDDENAVTERQLEYSDSGSLWAGYEDGYLVQLAELWTTADILVDDAFADCAVAFLGACESGQAALRVDVDEAVGLPSALTIAGVGTIIATLWPVGDVTALVYARLLYRRLALQSPGEFDLAALVRACRRELGRLKKDEVIDLLSELRDKTESKRSAAELDFVLQEIREGPDVPFGHPFHWAAFFSVGSARAELVQ